MHGMTMRIRSRLAALAAALPLLLAGCGGGIYLEFSDDDPPEVDLVASTGSAFPGETVRLSADAYDDDYVVEVAFYREESDGSLTLLGYDDRAPFQWDATMPNVPRDAAVYFAARAYDSLGQRSGTAYVSVLAD
jgi:hypothetical protein